MEWPKEIHPSGTRYASIEALRKLNLALVILLLLAGYVILNVFFGLLYFMYHALGACAGRLDYIYFSFVTGTTIGYGDLHPLNTSGKIITILQGLTSTFYFAMMIAFLGVKILFPRHTLHFSDKVLFDGKQFMFRILNSHRASLLNPEVRIGLVKHCYGNVIAPTISVLKIDSLYWLDNHDFIIGFPDIDTADGLGISISDEYQKALDHKGTERSRFKIKVSVSGSYGMQQYIQVVSYGKNDIVKGKSFKPIHYSDEDKRVWRNIRFNKFGDFWRDFNAIETR